MTTTASLTAGADRVAAPAISFPGSHEYDRDRRAWNLTADQRPAAVCVATNVAHVRAAVAYARARGLHLAAQSTGHFAQGLPPLERTLLLKLGLLGDEGIAVDPVARTARVPAGARWTDVVAAVAPHGLAAMHGSAPTVGVMGYLVGGGLSFYGRAHGLAANHVRAFEVVTADGRRPRAPRRREREPRAVLGAARRGRRLRRDHRGRDRPAALRGGHGRGAVLRWQLRGGAAARVA